VTITIKEVKTSKELALFIDLPWKIYADDPVWVPPLKFDVREFLDPKKHPFYLHGTATQFLAFRNDEPAGRILAADDPRYNEQNHTNTGTFGLFECVNDQTVANALLDAASDWLRNKGRTKITGPISYSTNYECGLLIQGFDMPPRIMMAHNPPYYVELLQNWGLAKNKDLYAWWFKDPYDIVQKWTPVLKRLAVLAKDITIRTFSRKTFGEDVEKCIEIYDSARKNWWWACVDLTSAEVRYLAKQLNRIGDEKQILIAEMDGKPIGFSLTMPDMNEAIKPLNGRLTWWGIPLGLIRFLWRLRHVKTARMMVLCVLPEYRHRGIAERMIMQTLDYGKTQRGYTSAELSWTDEDNDRINKIIKRVGAEMYKTYRVYEKSLET
jgi:GNAT superfamily N-acetyltransferase